MKKQINQYHHVLHYIDFQYQSPHSNQKFPHHLIHGRISKLFKVKEVPLHWKMLLQDIECVTAIQAIAGGRLRSVVVENYVIARDLLQKKLVQ